MADKNKSKELMFQIRFELSDLDAKGMNLDSPKGNSRALISILSSCNAEAISVYEAFAGYCHEAEINGIENYPLYNWTKSVISDPQKVKKHSKNFTVYVKGNEVYDKNTAEDIYNKLSSLPVCMKLNIHDTDPKNNPQMPKKYKL